VQQGGAEATREDLFLVPRGPAHHCAPTIYASTGMLKLLQPAGL